MGFFSPTDWNKQRAPLAVLPECGTCKLDQKCKTPRMRTHGRGKLRTLIVGEGPGFHEDERGIPFIGNAGGELTILLHELGVNLREDCWIENAISCRATDEHKRNRPPTTEEVGWCRPHILSVVERLKPERIILLGKPAVQSLIPYAWDNWDMTEYSGDGIMSRWAGWVIPSQRLNAWVIPTYHPSWLLRTKEYNRAAWGIVQGHLRRALACVGRPYSTAPDYAKQVRVELDAVAAAGQVGAYLLSGKPLAFDFETDRLKPDSQDSKILCCAVSDGVTAVAFPWRGEAITAMKELVQSNVPKIAANMRFEDRWCWRHLGCGVRNWSWDTMLGAHWVDCQHGVCGLKFQAFVRLGQPDYASHLAKLMDDGGKGSNSPNRLHEANIETLCLYCGTDALLEVLVAQEQQKFPMEN